MNNLFNRSIHDFLSLQMLTTKWFCQTQLHSLIQHSAISYKSIGELTYSMDPNGNVSFHLPFSKQSSINEPRACMLLMILTCIIVVPGRIRCSQPLVYLLI